MKWWRCDPIILRVSGEVRKQELSLAGLIGFVVKVLSQTNEHNQMLNC